MKVILIVIAVLNLITFTLFYGGGLLSILKCNAKEKEDQDKEKEKCQSQILFS